MEAGYLLSRGCSESRDLGHESISLRFFGGHHSVFLGLLPRHDRVWVELGQSVELGGARLIFDVEPSLAPLLDGLTERDVEVVDVGAYLDVEPPDWVGRPAVRLLLDDEQTLPQAPVRVGA